MMDVEIYDEKVVCEKVADVDDVELAVELELSRPVFLDPESNFVGNTLEDIIPLLPTFQGCVVCERYDRSDEEEKKNHHIQAFHCSLACTRTLKDGRKVFCLPCRKGCMKRTGKNVKRSHYHCPVCGNTSGRRANMLHHLKICEGGSRIANNEETASGSVGTPRKMTSTSDFEMNLDYDHVVTIMEKRLSSWIRGQRQAGKPVNVETLQLKAKFFFDKTKKDFGISKGKNFFGGRQWCKDFMKRNGMRDTTVVDLRHDAALTTPVPSKDIIKLIIGEVQRNPCLYDPLLAAIEGQSSERESDLWNEIAKNVGLDSGEVVKRIWKSLEERYIRRNKRGVLSGEHWEYEKCLQFLSSVIFESTSRDGQTVNLQQATQSIQDVEFAEDDLMTVTITGVDPDLMGSVEESGGEGSVFDRQVKLVKLRRINLEMENMKQEHFAKMEILQLQKEVLLKKLDKL